MMASSKARTGPAKVPNGVKEIADILNDGCEGIMTVMGVVHDYMPPKQTTGTDILLTLKLRDQSFYTSDIRIKYFRPTAKDLPQVRQNGDIVLLRRVKVCMLNDHVRRWGSLL